MPERAKRYPFPIPDHSYTLTETGPEPWAELPPTHHTEGRIPLLAFGSNQSPEQLAHKFSPLDGASILAERVVLDDFDVVYSAHISLYGSLPAALSPAPGTSANVFITWLTDAQTDRMHETEQVGDHYTFGRLEGIRIHRESGEQLDASYVYWSLGGGVVVEGSPIALAEIGAENRAFPAIEQTAMQAHMRDRLSPGTSLDDFIRQAIDVPAIRKDRTRLMREDAHPLIHDGFSPV